MVKLKIVGTGEGTERFPALRFGKKMEFAKEVKKCFIWLRCRV